MAFKILGRDGVNLTTAGSDAQHLSAESRKITNVVNPTAAQDAATKDYVDNATTAASSALDGTFRIKNTADQTKQTAFDVSAVAASTTRTIIMPNSNVDLGLVASAIQSSEKGANNGVAELGGDGKILAAQLPAIAITDTFVVASEVAMLALTAETGDVAVRTDLNKSFILAVNDPTVLANWQELLTPTSAVVSVNGQSGIVSLDSDDISEGAANFYYTSARFDADLATKTTDDLPEGLTNKYFSIPNLPTASTAVGGEFAVYNAGTLTHNRVSFSDVLASTDSDGISEGATNLYFTEAKVLATFLTGYVAGSDTALAATDTTLQGFEKLQGQVSAAKSAASTAQADATQAISDAAAAQSDIDDHLIDAVDAHDASSISVAAISNLVATEAQSAFAEHQSDIDGLEAVKGLSFEAGVAGEAMAADQIWLVRRAKNGETAGRYYKAMADSAINSRVVGFIIVGASAVSAADTVRVYKLGGGVLGSADSAFGATEGSLPVFLHQSTAGKWTLAPSETAGQWLKEVGFVGSTTILEFQPGMLIQA